MSDPIDPSRYPPLDQNRIHDLPANAAKPSTVDILVATVCALLETIGELTGREPEAEGLIKTIREDFGR